MQSLQGPFGAGLCRGGRAMTPDTHPLMPAVFNQEPPGGSRQTLSGEGGAPVAYTRIVPPTFNQVLPAANFPAGAPSTRAYQGPVPAAAGSAKADGTYAGNGAEAAKIRGEGG